MSNEHLFSSKLENVCFILWNKNILARIWLCRKLMSSKCSKWPGVRDYFCNPLRVVPENKFDCIFPSLNNAKIVRVNFGPRSQVVRQLGKSHAQWSIQQMRKSVRYWGEFEFITLERVFVGSIENIRNDFFSRVMGNESKREKTQMWTLLCGSRDLFVPLSDSMSFLGSSGIHPSAECLSSASIHSLWT